VDFAIGNHADPGRRRPAVSTRERSRAGDAPVDSPFLELEGPADGKEEAFGPRAAVLVIRSPFQSAFTPDGNSIGSPETAEEVSFDEPAPETEVDELFEKPDGDDQVLESESEAEQDHELQQERPTAEGSESVESAEVREECEEEPDIDEEATELGSVDTASVELDSWAAEGAHVSDANTGELELNDNDHRGARNYRSYFGESRRPPDNEFDQLTIAQLFGRIYGRANDPDIKGRLTFRDRALLNVALLAALNRDPELRTHLKAANYQGFSRDQLTEIMIHVAHYAGWPAGHNGMKVVEQFFEDKKQSRGREPQADSAGHS
jgi:alkylhydroperoxidase/carboxymuconolactone decarboxylase family protein YurZ